MKMRETYGVCVRNYNNSVAILNVNIGAASRTGPDLLQQSYIAWDRSKIYDEDNPYYY